MTVSRRILLHITLGASVVVMVVAAVTYRYVLETAERRTLDHLKTYAVERTRHQVADLGTIHGNMEVVRSLYLKRVISPAPPGLRERWDERVMRYPDGAWRSRMEFANPREHATVWTRKEMDVSPPSLHRLLTAQSVAEELMPAWIDTFSSLYIMFPGAACIGFNPLQPTWEWDTPADYPLEEQNWYRDATPAFNPSRGLVWTGVYADPISGIPYATVLLPVEENGVYYCTIGHDVTLRALLDEWTRSDFPGAVHMIFEDDGRLIAHPELREEILARDGGLSVRESGDPGLVSLFETVSNGQRDDIDAAGEWYHTASRLPVSNWLFVTILPRRVVREQALASARWVWISGGVSLVLLLSGFAALLRQDIGRPLAELSRAAEKMRAGDLSARSPRRRDDDLGRLSDSFNGLAAKVQEREEELVRINQSLELRVEERTAELHRALERERELVRMKGDFVSLVTHEFRTPLGVILSAADVLERYFERLDPEKRAHHLAMISRSTANLAAMIDEVLLLGRAEDGRLAYTPVPLDLGATLARLVDEIRSATGDRCPVELDLGEDLAGAVSDEAILRHVVGNLLSNAVKYSDPGSAVRVRAVREDGDLVLSFVDRGIGIPAEDRGRLFESFTRGSNVGDRPGTGLGLVVVERCVRAHGGSLGIESEPGKGTTATVRLPVFGGLGKA